MDKMIDRLDPLYPQLKRCWKRCHFCGKPTEHIHHIKGRSNLLLRYDLKNLIPLCANCHHLIHLNHLELMIPPARWLYLEQMSNIQLQDWLLSHNQTREEFFKTKETEIKEFINGKHHI